MTYRGCSLQSADLIHAVFIVNMSQISAVTKSGTGTWDLGRGDSGTWGRGDSGTRGRGDAGTRARGLGDSGTRGRGDVGTRERGDVGTRGRGDAATHFRSIEFQKSDNIAKKVELLVLFCFSSTS